MAFDAIHGKEQHYSQSINREGESTHPGLKSRLPLSIGEPGKHLWLCRYFNHSFFKPSWPLRKCIVAVLFFSESPTYADPRIFRKGRNANCNSCRKSWLWWRSEGIKVRFHWQQSSEMTPWIRVTTPHAGGGRDTFIRKRRRSSSWFWQSVTNHLYWAPCIMECEIRKGDGDNTIKSFPWQKRKCDPWW